MKNYKLVIEGIVSQGKMMGSKGSSFRDVATSNDSSSGINVGAGRNQSHENSAKDASAASEKARKKEIITRNKEAEQRQKETMQMSQEEAVTEAKTFKFRFTPPDSNMVRAYSSSSQPRKDLEALHDRWTKMHNHDMAKPKSQQGIHPGLSDKYAALSKALGFENKMPNHPNLGVRMNTEETNTKKRENIENVARMDGSKLTSEKSTLGKTGSIKTKIVEEKPTMSLPNFGLSASLIAAARQIVEKKDDVKLTGGNTPVKTSPETKDRTDDDEDTSTSKNKKKLDPVGKEDRKGDIDNDGDSDKSDSYLMNRRKAIGKAIKEDEQLDEEGRVKLGHVSAGPDVKNDVAAIRAKHKDTHTDFIVRTRGPKEPSAGLYKNIKVSPQGGMKSKSATGFAVYGRPKVAKEEVELDELSKKTLGSYVNKASNIATAHSYTAGKTGDVDTAEKASKRIRGIAKATNKLITQGDFTSDELARIDEIAQSIFEIAEPGLDQNGKQKGINTNNDVTNAVLSDEKKPGMDDDQHKHPMQQLEKIAHSVEGREPHFEHKDGSKTKVGKTLARQLKSVHDSMKTTQEKNKFADSVHASRDSMRAAADKHL
jgi:hypothetical protein